MKFTATGLGPIHARNMPLAALRFARKRAKLAYGRRGVVFEYSTEAQEEGRRWLVRSMAGVRGEAQRHWDHFHVWVA